MKDCFDVFKRVVAGVFLSLTVVNYSWAVEHITFEGAPMTISVHSDIERQIVFPERALIVIGISQQQLGSFKTLSSIDNRVFIQGTEGFKPQRVIFKDKTTGTNFVVMIQPSEDMALDRVVNIHLPKKAQKVDAKFVNESSQSKINSYPFLTRYVFQQMYSPTRLTKAHPMINRVSVKETPVQNLFGCFGANTACIDLIATPIVSYRTDRFYASAIEIQNRSRRAVEVDARMILRSPADLLAASFMHNRLLSIETGGKSKTILVLIHKRPLREFFYKGAK